MSKHFVAVSTALDKVADFGIDPANTFGFWDWVGGRYSVDSAIGTSLVVAIDPENFADFLAGFHGIDEHFRTTPYAQNVPALMGLLNVWYVNFLEAQSHTVLPYAQYLHRFVAYLQQLLFLANLFAQTAALAFGKTAEEVRVEGTAEAIVPARVFTGNRPTTSIMASALTPSVLGQLIALYEHITFTQGTVWGIDSFDQWGVELGKKLAQQLTPAVQGDADALASADSSTQSLISYYREHRDR